jgi:predicted amidophosphoribosyltransferase
MTMGRPLRLDDLFRVTCILCGSSKVTLTAEGCEDCGAFVNAECDECGVGFDYHAFKTIEVLDKLIALREVRK